MFRRLLLIVTVVSLIAAPAHAQLVVIDPANLVQTTLIAYRMQQHYAELRAQYLTILRMAPRPGQHGPLPDSHDPDHGARPEPLGLRQAVDSGPEQRRRDGRRVSLDDAAAAPADQLFRRTLTAAPGGLERQYATIEITDSVAMMGGHQVALARGYHGRLQDAVQSLESDVLNGLTRYHEMTAVLDKIAAGELLARRQDMLSNQLLSHALEQLLARGKRLRDTEAADHQHAARDLARCARRQRSVRRRHGRRAQDVASALRRTVSRKEATMRRLLLFTIVVVVVARPLNAQMAVYDPANTARNAITATIKEYLLETQREQHAKLRRMAQTAERLCRSATIRRARSAAVAYAWR